MRGGRAGGMHDGVKRQRNHSLGQTCKKYLRKQLGGDKARGKHGPGVTAGTAEREVNDAGTETGDVQVGG